MCPRGEGPGSVDRGEEAAGGAIEGEPSVLPGRALTESRQPLHVAPDRTGIRLVAFGQVVRLRGLLLREIDPSHGGSGDPSPFTALGVRRGIEACVKFRLQREDLKNVHVAVQGVGHVGYHLCKELHAAGAKLTVADVDKLKSERVQREMGANVVAIDEVAKVDCDVFAPCALGAGLNDDTIPHLRAKIVAGAANNQLAEPRHGDDLHARGILYAPDYAINAGGLISVANELEGYPHERAMKQAESIYDSIRTIFEIAKQENIPTYEASNRLAEKRITHVGHIRNVYAGKSEFVGRLSEVNHH